MRFQENGSKNFYLLRYFFFHHHPFLIWSPFLPATPFHAAPTRKPDLFAKFCLRKISWKYLKLCCAVVEEVAAATEALIVRVLAKRGHDFAVSLVFRWSITVPLHPHVIGRFFTTSLRMQEERRAVDKFGRTWRERVLRKEATAPSAKNIDRCSHLWDFPRTVGAAKGRGMVFWGFRISCAVW